MSCKAMSRFPLAFDAEQTLGGVIHKSPVYTEQPRIDNGSRSESYSTTEKLLHSSGMLMVAANAVILLVAEPEVVKEVG
jgi:hypothetical protein